MVKAVQRTNCINYRTNEYRAGISYKVLTEGGEIQTESMLKCNLKKKKNPQPKNGLMKSLKVLAA